MVIIVSNISSPQSDQVFTLEHEYVFMTPYFTFPKKTSPQGATTISYIWQDPELDPESTPQDLGLKHTSTTIFVHTKIVGEDLVSDQDLCWYVCKYPDKAVTFYNAGHPVVHGLVPTLYEIHTELLQLPEPVPPGSVTRQQTFHRLGESELYAQPKIVPQRVILVIP
jgi:hypothetical protein